MQDFAKAVVSSAGKHLLTYVLGILLTSKSPLEERVGQIDRLLQVIPEDTAETYPAVQQEVAAQQEVAVEEQIATGCIPCALGHFSASSGLLKEALRFKGEGLTSPQILDRIATVYEEQNTMERKDLAPERILQLPPWQRELAEEALEQSRQLRHRLESVQSVGELEKIAADTRNYYLKLNRAWYQGRFGYLGEEKVEAMVQRTEAPDGAD